MQKYTDRTFAASQPIIVEDFANKALHVAYMTVVALTIDGFTDIQEMR